jgi:hypothetical protein
MANKDQTTYVRKFASVMGDFTVECTHYDGINKYNVVVSDLDYSIDVSREYDLSQWHISGSDKHVTGNVMNKTIKMCVMDSFHPIYTILLKITDGPGKNVNLKQLLKDNKAQYVKQLRHYGMQKDWPSEHQTAYWYLIDYASTEALHTYNTLNVRITNGKVSFTSGTKKGNHIVYCNPETDTCIVFYKCDGCDRLMYFDLKDEDIQNYYDYIISKIPEPTKLGLSVSAANFDPYINISASPVSQPAVVEKVMPVSAATSEPKSGFTFTFDGDFIDITATVPIYKLEFHFHTGIQQLLVINSTFLVASNRMKCSVIDTGSSIVTLDIDDKSARLMFMNCGSSITHLLTCIKFNLA